MPQEEGPALATPAREALSTLADRAPSTSPFAFCPPALRPYQADVVARIDAAVAAGHRRVLLVAPTGAGKTVIAAELIRRERARGGRVLFLAHRLELVTQAASKLHDVGIDAGIIKACFEPRPGAPVQVAGIQTLHARAMRSRRMDLPAAALVIVDEAHHVRARTYREIIESYPEAVVVGMTATPCRGDGRGLGNAFDELVECPPVQALIDLTFLVPTKVYAPSIPDLTGVRVQAGDYVEKQLAERVDTAQLVGDIVAHWLRLAERRKTVVFATGVAHSVHVRDEFRRAGVLAEHIDGSTPLEERERILRDLSAGRAEVVCNCIVLTEGWDQPEVSCIVLARPTKHMGLYRQMVGRVLRPAPGKDHALVLDHAGATFQHGFVEDPVAWTLAADRRAESPAHAARTEWSAAKLTTCPECAAVRSAGQPCPACGWRPRAKPTAVDVAEGELQRLERDGHAADTWTAAERARFYAELLYIAREKGRVDGWAAHSYRSRFGRFPDSPPWARPAPVAPSDATRRWVRSRDIAYAKAMEKRGAA